MSKPIIGVAAHNIFNPTMYSQRITYPQAIENNGGTPVLLPCMPTTDNVASVVAMLDGLVVPGGADVDPSVYGEERQIYCGASSENDDTYEVALIKEAIKQGKPILAICRGMQLTNALMGGTLYQDIPLQHGVQQYHSMWPLGKENYHECTIDEGSYLATILGTNPTINSSHHQAVKDLAPGFKIVGRAPDGIPEAMESEDGQIVCVQWHPERMQEFPEMKRLVADFVKKCTK